MSAIATAVPAASQDAAVAEAPARRPRRAVVLGLVVAAATGALLARPIHGQLLEWIAAAGPLIREHPGPGMAVFVVLAALSTLVAFFSSALLVPVAVYAWGPAVCVVLLWSGWLLGGVAA